jgi:hypothetical protein
MGGIAFNRLTATEVNLLRGILHYAVMLTHIIKAAATFRDKTD